MPIRSPCINVCEIDFASLLCKGCGRTRDEVARWSLMSDVERDRIMAELEARMQSAGLSPPSTRAGT